MYGAPYQTELGLGTGYRRCMIFFWQVYVVFRWLHVASCSAGEEGAQLRVDCCSFYQSFEKELVLAGYHQNIKKSPTQVHFGIKISKSHPDRSSHPQQTKTNQ